MSKEILFSHRVPADLTPSPLHEAARRSAVIDLTASNPTECDFDYPAETLSALGLPASQTYAPQARGMLAAREALAEYLARIGQPVAVENLLLTASTSEAYGMLIKMLCDPGDAIAVGAPSYPLVQHLAELEGARVLTYRYLYSAGRWRLDIDSVRAVLDRGVRGLVLISPNNPTGSQPSDEELTELATLCGERSVPLIVDEVFAPYTFAPVPPERGIAARCIALAGTVLPLCFILNGLSKAVGLPQHKLGWIAAHGGRSVATAMARLEWIADAYLSVSQPVQVALPELLRIAPVMQAQIAARVRDNRRALSDLLAPCRAVQIAHAEAGWYAVLRVPRVMNDDELAMTLLRRAHALVHPGYFYDFPDDGWLVSGLLLPAKQFARGWRQVLAVFHDLFD